MNACRSAVAGTVLATLLAGCGGGSDSPRAAGSPGPAPSVEGTPAGEDPAPGEGIEVPPPPTPLPTGPVQLIEASRIRPAAPQGWEAAADHVVVPCPIGAAGRLEGETFQSDYLSGRRVASQVVTRLADPAGTDAAFAEVVRSVQECGGGEVTDLGWVDVGDETRVFRAGGTQDGRQVINLFAVYRLGNIVGAFAMADAPGEAPEEEFVVTAGQAFDPLG